MPLVLSGTNGISTNGTNWAILTDSSGRVTMPYQPHFRVNGATAAASQDISFSTVSSNIGNHWNSSTHIFTAPITGNYIFSWDGLHSNSSPYYARVIFKINGSANTSYGDSLEDWNGTYHSSHLTCIIRLSANDTVKLWNEGTPLHGNNYHSFSGILLS